MLGRLMTVLVAAATLATPALAVNDGRSRRVAVRNYSSQPIYEIHGSNSWRSGWEEDILGDNVIMPGASRIINFDDGTGACEFDLLAVTKYGQRLTKYGVNVCAVSNWTITD